MFFIHNKIKTVTKKTDATFYSLYYWTADISGIVKEYISLLLDLYRPIFQYFVLRNVNVIIPFWRFLFAHYFITNSKKEVLGTAFWCLIIANEFSHVLLTVKWELYIAFWTFLKFILTLNARLLYNYEWNLPVYNHIKFGKNAKTMYVTSRIKYSLI
jgi:hypothetical protein